jgi:hypothetical protein
MKFILVNFGGGIGNQLFQYATARALMKTGDLLLFNIDSYEGDYLERKFKLLNFNIKGSVITSKWFKKVFIPKTKFNLLIDKLGLYSFIKENGFFIHRELKIKTKLYTSMLGFWQSEIYFSEIRKELLAELTPKVIHELPEILKTENTVAVHVRRTDYLNDERYGFIGERYYNDAIAIVKQKIEKPVFILFSDDIEWCKKTFNQETILFCADSHFNEDYQQLYLMSMCKHQIIANSSFSWWGAWLNANEHKIVIRPQNPFKDVTFYYESFYPSNWLAI